MDGNVFWIKSYTVLVGQREYAAGKSAKKVDTTTLFTLIKFSSAIVKMHGNNLTT